MSEMSIFISTFKESQQLQEIILDSITILVISILFLVEMLVLASHFIEKQFSEIRQRVKVHFGVVRPATFLFFFSSTLSISFVPLYMEKLYEPFFGLSKDMVMGLPISIKTFFVGISFLISGAWLDRRGWHEPFFAGLVLADVGAVYIWMATDAIHFVIGSGIAGLGYGLFLMASQGFVISYTDESRKAQGLAQLFSGMYAGTICGGAAGAMLAEWIGYRQVFFWSAIILLAAIAYAILFMRNAIRKPERDFESQTTTPYLKIKQIFHFFFNRNIFSLFLFSSLPVNMSMMGFMNYFIPIYLDRIGTSQSNIGRMFMIYGFCIIYLGPLIGKYIDASVNRKLYIFANGILASSAFIIFYFLKGIFAGVIAVLLLGISQSFSFSSQNAYMLKLRVTKELGGGKAIAIFRSASRIGQVTGPIIFGWLTLSIGISEGITCFGFAYLVAILLFFLFAQNDSKLKNIS